MPWKKPKRQPLNFNDQQLALLVQNMIDAYDQFEMRREMVNDYVSHITAERDKLLGQIHDLEAEQRVIEDKLARLDVDR